MAANPSLSAFLWSVADLLRGDFTVLDGTPGAPSASDGGDSDALARVLEAISDATTIEELDQIAGKVDSLASSLRKHANAALESRAEMVRSKGQASGVEKSPTVPELLAAVDAPLNADELDVIQARAKRLMAGSALKGITTAIEVRSTALSAPPNGATEV